ncbi:MAG: PAS domain S-box protein [Tepidisphaera sp.]|nr:PAS domain S-box protein [Tepidisphaera sp.]
MSNTPSNMIPGVNLAPTPGEPPELTALRSIVVGTATATGPEFFSSLVKHLAAATGCRYAFIAEFLGDYRARTQAFWFVDHFSENVEWDVRGTPCQDVVYGGRCHYPSGVSSKFPTDEPLVRLGIESYLGVPLLDADGNTLGHLCVFDDRPMPDDPRRSFIFHIFAQRATAELLRLRAEQRLRESEEKFRDLFEEAPIAYVLEELDSKLIKANRAALRSLGLKPEEVTSTYGRSLAPDTPDAQRRMREAFEAVGRGTDTRGVVLELRRRDNGKPLWIEWWSSPDRSGTFTRTMFLDITDRVLMEQEQARLRAQNKYLRDEIKASHNFGEIVGAHPTLLSVLDNVERVAPTDSTVLIRGETGTGKELIARAIHDRSARRAMPFVKVNCAALPVGLVESEFFGHEKGSFTGAVSARRGRFELADGGTIFLDEVGEVAPDVQVKLLRVLQESEFERVGGTETVKVNVRVIAATNRDLAADVRAGKFRADLFYRLSVFPIAVPPLRERASDIPILATHFATQLAGTIGRRFDQIEASTMERLQRYPWPGNIRELRNVLERAAILCDGPILKVMDADLRASGEPTPAEPQIGSAALTLEEVERAHILAVLKQTDGTIAGPTGAAKILGVPPSTLRSTMARLGIKP